MGTPTSLHLVYPYTCPCVCLFISLYPYIALILYIPTYGHYPQEPHIRLRADLVYGRLIIGSNRKRLQSWPESLSAGGDNDTRHAGLILN